MKGKATTLVFFAALGGCCQVPTLPDSKGPTVTDLVRAINHAWAESRSKIDALGLRLDSVDLTLQAKTSTEAGGELEVLVLSAGSSQEVATSQTIAISLVEPSIARMADSASKLDVQSEIAAAIQRVASAASDVATTKATGAGDRPLALGKVSASIGFDVTTSASGELGLQLGGVKIGPSLSHTTSGSQEIELTFEPKK